MCLQIQHECAREREFTPTIIRWGDVFLERVEITEAAYITRANSGVILGAIACPHHKI